MPLCILLLFTSKGFGQDSLSNHLLTLEKSIYYSSSDTIRNALLIQKMDFMVKTKMENVEILKNSKRINYHLIEEKDEKTRFLWNVSVIAYLENDLYYALHCMEAYQSISNDTSMTFENLKFFIYSNYDTEKTKLIVSNLIEGDSIFTAYECYLDAQAYVVHQTQLKKMLSYILPGTGMMINGNSTKGLISMALNSVSAAAIYYLISHHLFINTLAWGSNLIMKFYVGNINLTKKLIDQKQVYIQKKRAKKCALSINECLLKYPINYKYSNQEF
jgi:hypothetical protein